MALIIKDGAGSTTSLKTTLTGSDHMPHHIVQAVSGTVQVTSSVSSPVYVTGNVSINQPINVDIDLSDKLTVVVSSSENNNTVWVTSSANYPISAKLDNISTTGAGPLKTALLVSLSGGIGNENKVQLYDSYVTVSNSGFQQMVNYLTAATDLGDSDYRIKVKITGSTENSPVYTTGTVAIGNIPTVNLGNVVTYYQSVPVVATQLTGISVISAGNHEALITTVTGTSIVSFGNTTPSFTASIENPVAVKLTDSYISASITNYATYGFTGGDALVVKVTGSDSDPISVTGNFNLNYSSYALPSGSALVVKITASAQDPVTVTGTLSVSSIGSPISVNNVNSISGTVNVTSSKGNPIFVISDTDKPVYIANTSSNGLFVTASNSFPLQTQKRSATIVQTQRYISNIYGFDWTVNSGTFVMATPDTDRKSLIIANPSDQELYIAVGSGSDPGFINGFLLQTVQMPPETYAFIIYPSGTYTADEYAASLFHAGFYISQSVNSQKTLVTRIGY